MEPDQQQDAVTRVAEVWERFTELVYRGTPPPLALDLLDLSNDDLAAYFVAYPYRRNEYAIIREARPAAKGKHEEGRRRREARREDDAYAFELFLRAFTNGMPMAESIKVSGIRNAPHLYAIMEADPTGARRQRYEEARKASLFVLEDRIEEIATKGARREKIVTRFDENGVEKPYERHVSVGDDTRALLAILRRRDPEHWNDRLVSNVGTMVAQEALDYSRLSNDELQALISLQEKARVVEGQAQRALPAPIDLDPDTEE